ncbi:MAG: SUMF1/EgtB/PvdO family nonheme iron enzyme [Minicystis sp.]
MQSFKPFLLALSLLAAGCSREGRAAPPAPSASSASETTVTSAVASASAPIPTVQPAATVAPASTAVTAIDAGPAAAIDAGVRSLTDCPEGMVKIGRFCVDRWEAHLVVRGASGEITPLPFFARPPEDGAYEARTAEGAYPQGYISRVEAARACKNAGKRLCSMAEWQRACWGKLGTSYPYGKHLEPDRCNMAKPHLLSIRHGADSRKWTYEAFNDPSLDREPGFLAAAGTYAQCTSDSGTFDMVGNLHEWVSDTVDEELIEKLSAEPVERKTQSWRPGNGVFMGGFFSTHEQLGPGCKYVTYAHEPSYHDYSTGFRCCADAPSAKKPKRR